MKPFTGVFVVTPGIFVLFIFVAFLEVQVKVTEPPFSIRSALDSNFISGVTTLPE